MKRLKVIFPAVIVLGMLCFVSTYKKDVLTQPTFPLEEKTITAALEKTGLPGEISESETTSFAEGHTLHVVRSPTETYSDTISPEDAQANPSSRVLTAGIDSSSVESRRMLSVTFDRRGIPEQFAWADWKQQIVFATLLYGGFEDEEDVYRTFFDKELPKGEDFFEWDAQLPGRYCRIHYTPRNTQTIYDEAGFPSRRKSGTMVVKIYESKSHYEEYIRKIADNSINPVVG